MTEAPNVRLHVLQLEAAHLERWLESGKLDFAMGSFPSMPKDIRRQPLWVERYVSVARRGHPRLSAEPTLRAFAAESMSWFRSRAAATRIRSCKRRWRPLSRMKMSSVKFPSSSALQFW
jgi:DNA-binding transcriptional LysR family regulator